MFSTKPILLLFCLIPLWASAVRAAEVSEVEFRADHYERDLKTNKMHMEGHTWIRYGHREVWADSVEWDTQTQQAVASGNVIMKDGPYQLWATRAQYDVKGTEATLEDATIVSGQLVITGAKIHKLNETQFEIDEGAYTNCNTDLVKDKGVSACQFDWKIYGSHISMTLDGYAHVRDAIVYMSQLPIFYTPYFVVPIKTKRQSGFLMPQFSYIQNLGEGISLPYYLALGPWDDLTLSPTWYGKAGYHLGLDYRYLYSYDAWGDYKLFINQYHFDPNISDAVRDYDTSRPTALGVIGEWAISAKNYASLGGRTFTRQVVNLVSDPYYSTDYGGDLPPQAGLNWLRTQLSITSPTDSWLFTGEVTHHQSLNITQGAGQDNGSVTQLPTLKLSKTTTPLLGKYISYEADARFDDFYRPSEYDLLPYNPNPANNTAPVVAPDLSSNDYYLRTGQRLQIEPRLLANVPMPSGFQFQPMLTAGTLMYHFDVPTSEVFHREYIEDELPISMYLHRNFDTGIPGLEHISHVFQPQVVFGSSLYQGATPNAPFFMTQASADPSQSSPSPFTNPYYTNPRWDLTDQMVPYEYFQFNLINRFRRQTDSGNERFLLLEVSEQWNLRTTAGDPRYGQVWEPLQGLAQVNVGHFTAQVQGDYNFQPIFNPTFPQVLNEWSTSIMYNGEKLDNVSLSTRFYQSSDPTQNQQSIYVSWYKTLPWFFDIEGNLEYDLLHGYPTNGSHLDDYQIGFVFGSKPRSCWNLELITGQNIQQQPFLLVNFHFDFGMNSAKGPL